MKDSLKRSNKKMDKNNNNKNVSKVFEQSWAYIRHTQSMFWQSFTALFTVIVAILLFSLDKDITIRFIACIASIVLSLLGFCVSNRIITILREHFATINRTREKLGIDSIPDLILERWKKKKHPEEFEMTDKEILHVFMANQLYILIFSLFVGYLIFLGINNWTNNLRLSMILFLMAAIIVAIYVEIKVRRNVYRYNP